MPSWIAGLIVISLRASSSVSFEHFNERLEQQSAPGRYEVLIASFNSCAILLPGLFVIASTRERVANHLLNSHACVWVPSLDTRKGRTARTLWVFAQRKLDPRHGPRKNKICHREPILDLHHSI